MPSPIRRFDVHYTQEDLAFLNSLIQQLASEAYLTNHNLVASLEKEFLRFTGADHCLAVSSGSSALLSIFQALRHVTNRTKILLPTNAFIACWQSCLQAGFQPELIDSDPSGLGVNLQQVEDQLKKSDVAAVMILHLGGMIWPQIQQLSDLCKLHSTYLIEDAAHAHGSQFENRKAGSWGLATAYSFHLTKVITGGEGGMVATSDSEFYKLLQSIRQFGKTESNPHIFDKVGGNYKMSEIQAAMILTDLRRADSRIKRRQEISNLYHRNFSNSKLAWLDSNSTSSSCYKVVGLLSEAGLREKVESHLAKHEVLMPNGIYFTPLHRQPIVKKLMNTQSEFPNSDKFCDHHICLPCYPELSDSDIFRVIELLNEALA